MLPPLIERLKLRPVSRNEKGPEVHAEPRKSKRKSRSRSPRDRSRRDRGRPSERPRLASPVRPGRDASPSPRTRRELKAPRSPPYAPLDEYPGQLVRVPQCRWCRSSTRRHGWLERQDEPGQRPAGPLERGAVEGPRREKTGIGPAGRRAAAKAKEGRAIREKAKARRTTGRKRKGVEVDPYSGRMQ